MKSRFFLLVVSLSVIPSLKGQQAAIDSLQNELLKPYPDSVQVKILDHLAFDYSTLDPKRGLVCARKAEALALKNGWEKWTANVYADYGVNYAALCDYKKAVTYNLRAVKVFKKLGNKSGQAGVLANISLLYLDQSMYDKALAYDLEALGILETLPDNPALAVVQENIGTIYLRQKNFSKTLYYYSLANIYYKKLNDYAGMARNLGNTGIVYNEMGQYHKALQCHQEALVLNKQFEDRDAMQINLANIGITHGYLNEYRQAVQHHLEAYKISSTLSDAKSDAINLGNAGDAYFRWAQKTKGQRGMVYLGQAQLFLQRAIELCREIDFKGPLAEFTHCLSEVYATAGDYHKALEVYKKYVSVHESIQAEETRINIATLEAKKEIALKDRDIVLKKQKIEISKLEAIKKRQERILYLSGNVLLVIVAFVLYKRLRKRSRGHSKVLSEIAATQSHEVRAPLARILGLANLLDSKNADAANNREIIGYIQTSAIELDKIIQKVVDKTYETRQIPGQKQVPRSFLSKIRVCGIKRKKQVRLKADL